MPLRAKITNPAFQQTQKYSMAAELPKELPGDDPDDVLFNQLYGVRTIELNTPKKLNSLDGSMARKIILRLKEWEKSQMANVIVIKGAGRAFCAGGDVVSLAKWNKKGEQQKSKDYFALEYRLDHLIATYSKPYVAFLDGITMGGGVGLSLHAPFRIATENTVFAMPETTIGFFPDVGGSFFLPRMDGGLGTYLALTSERIQGVNAFYNGIATHYLHSSSLPDLEARLAELVFKDYASLTERYKIINATIEEFVSGLPHDVPIAPSGKIRQAIDRCFSASNNSIESIIRALDSESAPEVQEWAANTKKTILQRSPTSVKVTLKQMREGRRWKLLETFEREHAIASHFMEHPDFTEGVSARLINKPATKPNWQPSTLEEVTKEQVDRFFELPPEGEERLSMLNGSAGHDQAEYIHGWTSLPTESEVERVVRSEGGTADAVVAHFMQNRGFKAGMEQRVREILSRKTRSDGGEVRWVAEL